MSHLVFVTLRAIFLLFLVWLLAIFLPGHTRGAITFNRDNAAGDDCCAPKVKKVASCCDSERSTDRKHEPTQKDRDACAVCVWAAGLIPTIPFVFVNDHVERAFAHARAYHAQVRRVAPRLNHFGRDPPSTPAFA